MEARELMEAGVLRPWDPATWPQPRREVPPVSSFGLRAREGPLGVSRSTPEPQVLHSQTEPRTPTSQATGG